MDVEMNKANQDHEKDSTVTLSGSSVILSPDEEMRREDVVMSNEVVSVDSLPKGNA